MGSSPRDDRGTLLGVAPEHHTERNESHADSLGPAPDTDHEALPLALQERGSFGRFTILDTLGQGGMGVVLAAYDPQLDRKVAIKVLRTRKLSGARREREAARLLGEARAMAKLSHPNVATVYDAGTIDDRVFIAMEYIPGRTLRQWLADGKHSVDDILDVFVKAGRGLAAGHHAGLIHRDFKPENVLIGHDGRVCVIDFGLAQAARSPHESDEGYPSDGGETPRETRTRGVFGTPLYMAPEQHERRELDARTDQFAFCVALFEALYGRPPYPANNFFELTTAVMTGKIEMPNAKPDIIRIPPRVADAVLRGLRTKREDRFPLMDALLDEIAPPPAKKRVLGLTWVVGGAVAAAVLTLVIVRAVGGGDDPCAGGDARLRGVWDVDVRDRVKATFLASRRSHAADTVGRVANNLDSYAASWIDRRQKVCEATHVRKEQSDAAFDLRMQCLANHLAELKTLTTLFVSADVAMIDNAVSATTSLPKPDDCVTMTLGATPAPTPMQKGALAVLETEIAAARANVAALRYPVAIEKAKDVLARAKPFAYPMFDAHARYTLALALSGASKPADAERELRTALVDAARAKDDALSASLWTTLIFIVGAQLGRYADAVALEPVARVAIARAGTNPRLESDLGYQMGYAHLTKGEVKLATESFETALKALGPNPPETVVVAQLLGALGGAYLRGGNVLGAKGAFERSLAIIDKTLGPSHPAIAVPLGNLGALSQALGNFDEAIQYQQRALKILEELHGADNVNVGLTVYGLGVSSNGKEDYKGAIPYYERALAIFEKLGPDHPYVGLALVGLADCREEVGDAARAVPEAERGLKLVEAGSDKVQMALGRYVLAKALWSSNKDRARARTLMREARDGFAAGGILAMNGLVAVDKWLKKMGS